MARQETWEALTCPQGERRKQGGPADQKTPGPTTVPAGRRERAADTNERALCGTDRRNNKPEGCRPGSRSAFILPMTAGNPVHGDPSEEREASHVQTH